MKEGDLMKQCRYRFSTLVLGFLLLSLMLVACRSQPQSATPAANCLRVLTGASDTSIPPACHKRLLVFSKTAGYRHASIPAGKIALQALASQHGFSIDFSEDSSVFTTANLARYNAVIFLMTTGEIFNASQEAAFQHYIESGGGFVGIHSASDTMYNWPWYGGLVGAFNDVFNKHSTIQPAVVHVEDPDTPSTDMLPIYWQRTDEWYNFAVNPRPYVHVLLTVDERTYTGGIMGPDHPISWYHAYDGGRSWYTAMGHTTETYYEPLFRAYLWGGILYAVGLWPRSATTSSHPATALFSSLINPLKIIDVRPIIKYDTLCSMSCCC
jgi:type 1 glutamine amidotransferase